MLTDLAKRYIGRQYFIKGNEDLANIAARWRRAYPSASFTVKAALVYVNRVRRRLKEGERVQRAIYDENYSSEQPQLSVVAKKAAPRPKRANAKAVKKRK